MDELTEYLLYTKYYRITELECILNKKIIITPEHVKCIKQYHIIKLFKKYGYVFTEDDYIYLMLNRNNAFEFISDDEKTNKLCVIAVKQYGQNLRSIPKNKITDEICKLAIQQNYHAFKYVPTDKKTYELCKTAVQQAGNALQYVPDNKKTDELYKIAVQQNGYALQYVPEDKKTIDICRIAVSQCIDSLYFVPEDIYEKMFNHKNT